MVRRSSSTGGSGSTASLRPRPGTPYGSMYDALDTWTPRSDPRLRPSRQVLRGRLALSVVLVAVFMVYVDLSIVFVAMPTLERNAHATFSQAEWVIAGYELGYATVLMAGGRLGDIFGCRSIFILGMTVFAAASAACGFSPHPAVLDTARVIQGIGAGLLYPQVLPVIRALPTEQARRTAIGGLGATVGFAFVAGPLLGGGLIALNLGGAAGSWRPIFLVNVPFALFAIVGGIFSLPPPGPRNRLRMNAVSTCLVSASLFFLVLPLVEAPDSGWHGTSIELFAVSALLAGAFFWWERRDIRRKVAPLVEPELVKDRAFSSGAVLTFVLFFGVPGLFFILTLFLQFGAGFSPLRTGLTALPYAIGTAAGAGLSMHFIDRIGKKGLYLGCLLLLGGTVVLARSVAGMGDLAHSGGLLLPLLVCGLGCGVTVAPITSIMLASIKVKDPGSAAGIITAAQQVGGAMGIAVMGVLFFSFLGSHSAGLLQQQAPAIERQLATAGAPPALQTLAVKDYSACFTQTAEHRDLVVLPKICHALDWATPKDGVFYQARLILQSAGKSGTASLLGSGSEKVLLVDMSTFVLAFAVTLKLPKPSPERLIDSTPML